jgi:hypothetical protein
MYLPRKDGNFYQISKMMARAMRFLVTDQDQLYSTHIPLNQQQNNILEYEVTV